MRDSTQRKIAEIERLAHRSRRNSRAQGNLGRNLREQYLKLVDDAFAIIEAHGGYLSFQVGPYTYSRHSPQHALEAWTNGYPVVPWSSIETERQFEEMVGELKVGIQKKLRSLRRRAS